MFTCYVYPISMYVYILSGCKKRSERFSCVFCTNVFSTFSSLKNVEKTTRKRRKNESKKRRKNGHKNVGKTVSFSIHPPTLSPWRHISSKGGHGIVTVKNVQKTFKKRRKNVWAKECDFWGAGLEASRRSQPCSFPVVADQRKKRRKNNKKT